MGFLLVLSGIILVLVVDKPKKQHDYQLDVTNKEYTLWANDTLVGIVPITWKAPLDSLIISDNQ